MRVFDGVRRAGQDLVVKTSRIAPTAPLLTLGTLDQLRGGAEPAMRLPMRRFRLTNAAANQVENRAPPSRSALAGYDATRAEIITAFKFYVREEAREYDVALRAASLRQDAPAVKAAQDELDVLALFKNDAGTFVRLYTFLSQIFDYGNTAIEKRAIFFRRLVPLLDFGRERLGVDLSNVVLTQYEDKRLAGIQAVQTLSRLNWAYPGKDTTYVLDFSNDGNEVLEDFKTYYETAQLASTTDPNLVFDLRAKLDAGGSTTTSRSTAWCRWNSIPRPGRANLWRRWSRWWTGC